ncbi:hypothetical protein [Kitasatospora viridis]|uniref:Uncharacterized protein n=1 Tax=Kitasatospora viridis TaxID=281105 RepID=A0A561T748_9ACTN|nr:hypothetical protein [Kitasatospora viridis]TWF82943.1 hypothetical protein FHX73_14426 [Kitasatospora viridis]
MSLNPAPRRWPLTTLKVFAALTALLALAEPFLAGGFLQGYYPLLQAHMIAAMILSTAVLLAAIAGLLVWKAAGGPSTPAIQYGILLLCCVAQISLGFSRVLLIHVPLGVGIFVMAEKFAVEAFRLRPGGATGSAAGSPAAPAAEPAVAE